VPFQFSLARRSTAVLVSRCTRRMHRAWADQVGTVPARRTALRARRGAEPPRPLDRRIHRSRARLPSRNAILRASFCICAPAATISKMSCTPPDSTSLHV
jgi:hypothetical protein